MSTRERIAGAAVALVALVALASSAAACAGTSAGRAAPAAPATASLESWGRHHSGVFTMLSYDASTVSDYASTFDTTDLGAACAKVRQDIDGYHALPPVPDPAAMGHLRSALDLYGRAAADCIDGTSAGNAAMIDRAAAELDRAGSELGATLRTLDLASGR